MVFEKDRDTRSRYAVGEDGYFREVILRSEHGDEWFLANACTYVPSFVLMKQPAGGDWEKQRFDQNMSRFGALEKRINEYYMRKVLMPNLCYIFFSLNNITLLILVLLMCFFPCMLLILFIPMYAI